MDCVLCPLSCYFSSFARTARKRTDRRGDDSVPVDWRVRSWTDELNLLTDQKVLRTGSEQERGNICQPAALGQWGVRGRVRISTYTVTKLEKGKPVESEAGSSLWIRKAETVQSAIHTESVNRKRGKCTHGVKNICHHPALQNSKAAFWGSVERGETEAVRLIRSQTASKHVSYFLIAETRVSSPREHCD